MDRYAPNLRTLQMEGMRELKNGTWTGALLFRYSTELLNVILNMSLTLILTLALTLDLDPWP